VIAPLATRARTTGKPGTLTWQQATSSRCPLIGRQSPLGALARSVRSWDWGDLRPQRAPATQMPHLSSPTLTSATALAVLS
jgi:hypothetical protein